jgi:hypothetical protein
MNDANSFEIHRRTFLRYGLSGLGLLGLNSLMADQQGSDGAGSHGVINPLHYPAKAKRVIFLYQAGGPSHLETFDPKPKLAELHGKGMPESFTKGQQIAQLQGKPLICFGPQHGFKKYGKNGLEICDLFPRIGSVADDVCIIRSMWTEQINHDPAHTIMNTGSILPGRPEHGVVGAIRAGRGDAGSAGLRGAAFRGQGRADAADRGASVVGGPAAQPLPGRQAEFDRRRGAAHQEPARHECGDAEDSIDAINALNRAQYSTLKDPEILTRVAQYEMAFKMQSSVPDLVDMSKSRRRCSTCTARTRRRSFASNCLLARRLAERGVRSSSSIIAIGTITAA